MIYKLEKPQIKILKLVLKESKEEGSPIMEHTVQVVERILESGTYLESDSGLLNMLTQYIKAK